MKLIPLFKPSVSQEEINAVTKTLLSGWWGMGSQVVELEDTFAKMVGVRYAVAVNSATAALDLTLKAYDISHAEVILPALTFVSTGLAALYNNNNVVFADVREDSLTLDWNDALGKITPQTNAIIPVDYAGVYAGVPVKNVQIPLVIEDAAHAAGNSLAGKDYVACWSFHAVKNLAAGDGGMITTNDQAIYERLKRLRWCGISKSTYERTEKKYGWDYDIEEIGYKCHMNDLTASLALAQLNRLPRLNQMRRLLVTKYLSDLSSLSWLRLPEWDEQSSWHMFVVRVDETLRDRFIDYMLSHNISVGVHYKPLNQYKIFPQTPLPVTDRVWKELVTLPLFPDLTLEEHDYIVKTIKGFLP